MFGVDSVENLKRNILCIDLKSFFAFCECVERKLNPYTTPLVVADSSRGDGAITLAISPFLKEKGVKSRGRIFEIPKNINYLRVKPRMNLYMKKSTEVINIYLDFIAKEDIHIYSIDEAFLDVTDYLKLYKKEDYELAEEILNTILKKTGLAANCGIGPNMLLAKVSLDLEAKSAKNGIVKWSYEDVPSKLWTLKPLSKMWGIGKNMEKRLNNLGLYSIGDIAHCSETLLIKKFGVMGTELYNHAHGIDLSIIKDWNMPPKDKSISHSQVLFKDYYGHNIKLIIKEMVPVLTKRLREMKVLAGSIYFGIRYSKEEQGGFSKSFKLENPTDSDDEITSLYVFLFDKYYIESMPIRQVHMAFSRFIEKDSIQLNLFETFETQTKKNNVSNIIDEIHLKYGKNSVLKASSLLNDSNARMRNKKIGGHNA